MPTLHRSVDLINKLEPQETRTPVSAKDEQIQIVLGWGSFHVSNEDNDDGGVTQFGRAA